jgi:hypothetical protein
MYSESSITEKLICNNPVSYRLCPRTQHKHRVQKRNHIFSYMATAVTKMIICWVSSGVQSVYRSINKRKTRFEWPMELIRNVAKICYEILNYTNIFLWHEIVFMALSAEIVICSVVTPHSLESGCCNMLLLFLSIDQEGGVSPFPRNVQDCT